MERGLYKYLMNNILRTAKFLTTSSLYLTPCCGLEVQKPTQALKSVKGPGNTFDINPKWFLPTWGFNQRYFTGL
jgi:hypothetical protein